MTLFFAVLIVLVIGATVIVASGRGASMGPAYGDRADVLLPADRDVSGQDLRALRFNTALRGYRASEVDALIDRLAGQLDERCSNTDRFPDRYPEAGSGPEPDNGEPPAVSGR